MTKRHTRAEIESVLAQREREGLSYAELSERTGIPASTLTWWSWRRRREGRRRGRKRSGGVFAEVVEVADRQPKDKPMEVVTSSGVSVFVPPGFDADALDRLMTLLERRC